MKHERLSFEDIMQNNILYYDKNLEPACTVICNYLKIDNLPAINRPYYYQWNNNRFHKKSISKRNKISSSEPIFSKHAIKQILGSRHNVIFVFEEKVMRGVAHISDYNCDIVL